MKGYIAVALVLAVAALVHAGPAEAGTELNARMTELLGSYQGSAGVKAFNAEDGKKLFTLKRTHSEKNESRGCTTCHTSDPAATGKTPVGKAIDPISPAANAERFTDPKKVEKWFKRNCKWVLERECTPEEKGAFITFMKSL